MKKNVKRFRAQIVCHPNSIKIPLKSRLENWVMWYLGSDGGEFNIDAIITALPLPLGIGDWVLWPRNLASGSGFGC